MITSFDLILNITLVVVSVYILAKAFVRRSHDVNSTTNDNDDDDSLFQSNPDKRSLRPSYGRFLRRQMHEELATNDSSLCIICWNNRKTIVLLPCRHLCVCVSCRRQMWNEIRHETCPICRKNVEQLLEVFL